MTNTLSCHTDSTNLALSFWHTLRLHADEGNATILDGWSSSLWHKKLVRKAFAGLPPEYQAQHERNMAPLNGSEVYLKRTADFFYVPRRLALPLAFHLLPAFAEFGVWSEVAIPMMFYALEHPSRHDKIFSKVDFQWDRGDKYNPLHFWSPHLSGYHYWKLSSGANRVALLRAFSRIDPCTKILLRREEKDLARARAAEAAAAAAAAAAGPAAAPAPAPAASPAAAPT